MRWIDQLKNNIIIHVSCSIPLFLLRLFVYPLVGLFCSCCFAIHFILGDFWSTLNTNPKSCIRIYFFVSEEISPFGNELCSTI